MQVIEIQELRSDDAVEAFGKALVLAGTGNVQIADVDQVLQLVVQHVGPGELEGIIDDVAGHDMAEAVTGGHQTEHATTAAQLQHGLALGLQLAQKAPQHEGARPDLGPERQVFQRVMDGVPCQQPVQMALHIVDVQDLQLAVIQLQGNKVHIEGLADVRKDLVQHRRLPYIFPPGRIRPGWPEKACGILRGSLGKSEKLKKRRRPARGRTHEADGKRPMPTIHTGICAANQHAGLTGPGVRARQNA